MDEIIQILIIKIAGQETRQKDLEERTSIILEVKSNTIKIFFESRILCTILPASTSDFAFPCYTPKYYPFMYSLHCD